MFAPRHRLAIPESDRDFEHVALTCARERLHVQDGDLYGRPGQKQHGVDALLRPPEGLTGLQSKRYYETPLTTQLLEQDLRAAEAKFPEMKRYIVATTASRDTKLSDWARDARLHGRPAVEIWFWDVFVDWISADPIRKSKYLELNPYDHARGLSALLKVRSPEQILTFASTTEGLSASGDPESVVRARAHLESSRPDLALTAIGPLTESGAPPAAAWLIRATAQTQLGDPSAALATLEVAAASGHEGPRVDLARSTALRMLHREDEADELLDRANANAQGADRAQILGIWLSHLLEREQLTYEQLLDRVSVEDLELPSVHIALGNAAAVAGDRVRTAEHAQRLVGVPRIPHYIAGVLNAIAAVCGAQQQLEAAGRLEPELEASLPEHARVLQHAADELNRVPTLPNRLLVAGWLAHARILCADFEAADAAVLDFVRISSASEVAVKLAFDYSVSRGRAGLASRLLELGPTHPAARLLALPTFSPDAATSEMVELVASLRDESPWLPFVLAEAVAGPFLQGHSTAWAERALRLCEVSEDAELLLVALADLLRRSEFEELHERILATLRRFETHKSLRVEAQLRIAAAAREANHEDVAERYGLRIDRELETTNAAMRDVDSRILAVRDAIARLYLERAGRYLERWFPIATPDRRGLLLRAELAVARGEPAGAHDSLARILDEGLARPRDVWRYVQAALKTGRLREARRRLRRIELPATARPDELHALEEALLRVTLLRSRERLLEQLTAGTGPNEVAFAATAKQIMARRRAPAPQVVAEHTFVVLQSAATQTTRLVWITPQHGDSAPDVERLTPADAEAVPLLGRRLGDEIAVAHGTHAGTWRIVELLPSSFGLHRQQLHYAARRGLAAGGVDVVDARGDPLETMRRMLSESDQALDEPPAPLICIAHIRDQMPLAILNTVTRLPLAEGTNREFVNDSQTLQGHKDRGVIVDPVTLLLLENYGLTETVARAAGGLWVAPQVRDTFAEWWWEERERRHSVGSAGVDRGTGALNVQIHDAAFRKRGAGFWLNFLSRETTGIVRVVAEPFSDATGGRVQPLVRIMGFSGAATAAHAVQQRLPVLSIDRALVALFRDVGVPAVTILGVLHDGLKRGRIKASESARVKAWLGLGRWEFIRANVDELVSVIAGNDPQRDQLFAGLTSSFPQSELRGVLSVVTEALDRAGPMRPAINGEPTPIAMFRRLPPPPENGLREATSHIRKARHAWYASGFNAWRHGRLNTPAERKRSR